VIVPLIHTRFSSMSIRNDQFPSLCAAQREIMIGID
jgi:hypothetical protein